MPIKVLGGSWVAISGVISRVTIVVTQIMGLTTPLITTHEPPSREYISHPDWRHKTQYNNKTDLVVP